MCSPRILKKPTSAGVVLLITGLLLCLSNAYAQPFKLMRFDEDYSYLKDSSRNWYRQFKFVPLSPDGNIYASFGGEARAEFVAFNNEDWGRMGIGHNNFLLQRYDLHTDVHFGNRFRVFGQIRSALENGRKTGPRPIDEDKLNIQNLFADVVAVKEAKTSLTFRLGRQELDYGSGRLISVREGPNARLYFTGAKAMLVKQNLRLDAFVMMADTVNPGAFDNKPSKQANLWGGYGTLIIPRSGNIDFYYVGIRRDTSVFEAGAAKETRHTIGGRFWRYGGGFIYNLEGAYQFGTFGTGRISAWTGSADIGYFFENAPLKPSINLRHDYISGDANPGDNRLETFNPIYPKGGYFGFNPQIGPVNLIDIHPYATIKAGKQVTVQGDVVFNWRYSLNDGVYRPSGTFNMPGETSRKRYIGTAYLLSAVWQINSFLSLNQGIQYFSTGSFVHDVIPNPHDGLFINTRIAFKF
ncbi:alginate export family protein [Mucilaginibacter sp. RS28]|uniref:Alginate export family protein n=1 Tax=Mucilaginibacter straminoryzae TaxID=2932774 RepID=A0A9X1X4F2_9SPHI|nr:alginate export family protein [Mucilaginibacter straminoryzae]MCJ8208369.1 alginate export family protein [Mucilaginibacter straminoryzae]